VELAGRGREREGGAAMTPGKREIAGNDEGTALLVSYLSYLSLPSRKTEDGRNADRISAR